MKIMPYLAFCVAACGAFAGEVFKHAVYDAVPLDGAWEMAYRPYAHESVDYPRFAGVMVADAVPGYWEDMIDAFRAAGMKDEFRINPLYGRQTLPITGWADDTTLPNISGCFYYRRGRAGVRGRAQPGARVDQRTVRRVSGGLLHAV